MNSLSVILGTNADVLTNRTEALKLIGQSMEAQNVFVNATIKALENQIDILNTTLVNTTAAYNATKNYALAVEQHLAVSQKNASYQAELANALRQQLDILNKTLENVNSTSQAHLQVLIERDAVQQEIIETLNASLIATHANRTADREQSRAVVSQLQTMVKVAWGAGIGGGVLLSILTGLISYIIGKRHGKAENPLQNDQIRESSQNPLRAMEERIGMSEVSRTQQQQTTGGAGASNIQPATFTTVFSPEPKKPSE